MNATGEVVYLNDDGQVISTTRGVLATADPNRGNPSINSFGEVVYLNEAWS
jgi:hypothetical protein